MAERNEDARHCLYDRDSYHSHCGPILVLIVSPYGLPS